MQKKSTGRAVVLLSGGVDSSTALALAKSEGLLCHALSFDYGQRHRIELDAASRIAKALGVERHLVVKLDMTGIGGSALIESAGISVPKGGQSEGIPVTYVPARNTLFLSYALSWAEVLNASGIFLGANVMDYSGYPDCRPEYLDAFERMANLATKASVEGRIKFTVRAPLLKMSKAEIIRLGRRLGLDYALTWSCYDPTQEGKPCGGCDSCLIRERGMREAGQVI